MSYQPTWASVRSHPLPRWYADAKFGIFVHWGLYSVPAFAPRGRPAAGEPDEDGSPFARSPYAEWYQNSLRIPDSPTYRHHLRTYGADFRYEQFAERFNAGLPGWDPDAWADLFARAGARYAVLVTKHHDGFLMWDSRTPNPHIAGWQAARDVAGELSRAVTAAGLKMGFYYSSLLDWSFTGAPITTVQELVAASDISRGYVAYIERHWLELIERYDPWILWSDIGYPPGYHLPGLFARFYNRNPEGVVNDRWLQLPRFLFSRPGRFILGQALKHVHGDAPPKVPHSDFVTPEYAALGRITRHKWETCRGIGNSFGYNQFEDAGDYRTAGALIRLLADVVSKNGNLLLNVGPCADGAIHPLQAAALEGMGRWLRANGEAIYGTRPWARFADALPNGGEVRYTATGDARYAIVTATPADGALSLPPDLPGRATLLATGEELGAARPGEGLRVILPAGVPEGAVPVVKVKPPP